jgi:hypothetical protein
MCVLPMGLKADLSVFEQGTYAYGSGRSIGGVYSCTPRSIWLPQLHALIRTCDTEFTMSMYFARYVATVIGMNGANGGIHIQNVYVNSPECLRALVYWRFSPRLCTRCAPCLRGHVVDARAVLRVQLSAEMRAPRPDASLWTLEAVGTATP